MIQFDDLVLYDVDETAERLDMRRPRVEQLLRADLLRGVVHGGRWLVAADEIDAFRARWNPPVRPSRAGTSRRFRPPALPAESPTEG